MAPDHPEIPQPSGEFRIGILTHAYEESIRFYGTFLGLSVRDSWDRGPRERGTLFEHGNTVVELLFVQEESALHGRAVTWLYVEVGSVDAFAQRAAELGVEVVFGPRDEDWGHRRMKVRDPNGLEIGLFQRP